MNDNRVDEGHAMIRRVNEFRLDPDILASALETYHEADPATRGGMDEYADIIARSVFSEGLTGEGAVDAAIAIQFRVSALWRLLEQGGGRGFSAKGLKSGYRLDTDMVRCAAAEPLVVADGPVRFNEESFHRRLLAMATTAGKA